MTQVLKQSGTAKIRGIVAACDNKRLSRGYNSIVVLMLTVHMDVSVVEAGV